MTWPTHSNQIDDDRQALAPYNFVPLPERIVKLDEADLPDQSRFYNPSYLSGYLTCELTTASPIYIRAGVKPADYQAGAKSKDQSPFFFVNDGNEPIIPGSSLRGLLRNLVAIASFSKMSGVSDQRLVYRSVGDTTNHGLRYRERLIRDDGNHYYTPLIRGGYIEKKNGEFYIRPAKEIGGTTYAYIAIDETLFNKLRPVKGCMNASEIYIQVGKYDYQRIRGGFLHVKYARVLSASVNPTTGYRRGTLAISGWMNSKRTEAVIYEADPGAKLITIDDDLIDLYREQVSKEQETLLGGKQGVLQEGQPIFFVLDERGNLFFFGHARQFRIPYAKSPRDFVPPALRREDDLDMAEAVFGFTKQSRNGESHAYASRVFVSDAALAESQDRKHIWLTGGNHIVVPKTLGSPKPTTFQHYLVQQTPNSKQIGRTKDGRPKYALFLSDYAAMTPGETVLRGDKQYWHKGPVGLDDIRETKGLKSSDAVHTRIQPLREGVRFRFRIDFQNLAREELGALLWVLKVAADDRYRLKLGMGKPLGLGAVKIDSRLYLIDHKARYSTLFGANDWLTGERDAEQARHDAIQKFEQIVLGQLGGSVQRLEKLERIEELLSLLSWPGPDPAQTRYLEIDRREGRRKINEYRPRPVLPSPTTVLPEIGRDQSNDSRQGQSTGASTGTELPKDHYRGRVKFYNGKYGFIVPDIAIPALQGKDAYVHRRNLAAGVATLRDNQRVVFKLAKGMRGLEAQDVRPE